MSEEIFDVVDDQDRVIGQAARSVVHAGKLLHRAVHIFVFNTRGDLLLQMRSAGKDEYPLCYTSSASGHLGAGESYETAAPRELHEELGLSAPLEWLAKFPAGPETAHEHTVLFGTTSDSPLTIDTGEIAHVEFRSVAEIEAMILADPGKFSPPFVVLFDWYRRRISPQPLPGLPLAGRPIGGAPDDGQPPAPSGGTGATHHEHER